DGGTQVPQAPPPLRVPDREIEGLLSDLQKALHLGIDNADGDGRCGISHPAILDHSTIDFYDVAVLNSTWSADAVNYFLVQRNANVAGKFFVTEKGALAAILRHEIRRGLIYVFSRNPGANHCRDMIED